MDRRSRDFMFMSSPTRGALKGPWLGLLVILVACSADSDGPADPRASAREIRLSPEPVLSIGVVGGDPDYELFDVYGAVQLGDGRIVVANRGTSELRYYDSAGEHVHTAGGAGEGPGEFADLRYVGAIQGDTVIAYDFDLRRVSVFDEEGEFVRSFTVDVSTGTVRMFGVSGPARPYEVLALHDGRIVARPDGPLYLARQSTPNDGVHRAEYSLFMLDYDGRIDSTIGPFPGEEVFVQGTGGRGRLGGPQLLTAAGSASVFVASGIEPSVAVIGAQGGVDTVSVNWPRREYTQEYWQRRIDATYSFFGEQESVLELLNAMPKPDSLPRFSRLLADPRDRVWLGVYRESETWTDAEPAEWLVTDRTGQVLGTVAAPDGLEITHVGNGFVTGVTRDEFEVERVQVYRILDAI